MNELSGESRATEAMYGAERKEHQRRSLISRIETSVGVAERNGVTSAICLLSPERGNEQTQPLFEHNPELQMHPASTIKVAQAIYIGERLSGLSVEELTDEQAVDWSDLTENDFPRQGGGGDFDQPEAPRHASYEQLLNDMLCAGKSGNMAAKVLMGKNSAGDFNEYWERCGYRSLQLELRGDWYAIKDALPNELARMSGEIYKANLSGNVRAIINEALETQGKYGTVSGAIDISGSQCGRVASKTGELPPDEETPYHMRHAVGEIRGPQGKFLFAIMTQAPNRLALASSLQLIDELGALMGKEAGLSVSSRTRRVMAGVGLQAAGVVNKVIR